jgi:hypothetical protein
MDRAYRSRVSTNILRGLLVMGSASEGSRSTRVEGQTPMRRGWRTQGKEAARMGAVVEMARSV